MSSPSRRGPMVAALILCAAACNTESLRYIPEPSTVSVGGPELSPNGNSVLTRTGASSGEFTPTAPEQCDTFLQQEAAQIDILFVIDDTGSMCPKQKRLQDGFSAFMQQLLTPDQNGVIPDFHIGVITMDMYDPDQSGNLVNTANLPHPWIGTDTCGSSCDAASLEALFTTNSSVGTSGPGVPMGMLAATTALTPPLSTGGNAGFLRDAANLIIIFVTDSEDCSCAPIDMDVDTYTYGCTTPLEWGEPAYYARLFTGLKGYGNEGMVKVYTIVGTTQTVAVPDSNGMIQGCLVTDPDPSCDESGEGDTYEYAWYAPRWIALSTAVTGPTGPQSICSGSFDAPLMTIATPLQSEFYLSRTPTTATSIECTVTDDGTTTVSGATDYSYSSTADAVTYVTPPAAGSVVKCCYAAH